MGHRRRNDSSCPLAAVRAFPIAALLAQTALAASAPGVVAAAGSRFTAALEDGRRVGGDEVRPWHAIDAAPRLGGVELFDPRNPVVWIRDESLRAPREPQAFVELIGGDVLPGQVVDGSYGDGPLDECTPPFVLVEPEVGVDAPNAPPRSGVRIVTRWLRRVVWTRSDDRTTFEPGTAYFRDGSSVRFRSVRWGRGELRLLIDDGISQVSFDRIAEIHLPESDPWDAWFEQLAILSPGLESRLLCVETVDGARLTASTERFRATAHGASKDPANWLHVVAPAWSLDALWIPYRSIRAHTFHAPDRVPLSRLDPSRVEQRSLFGASWTWRRNRSVEDDELLCGGERWGWGFGVHARTELEFELCDAVRALRTRVGLDHVVGEGGCARAELRLRGARSGLRAERTHDSVPVAPDSGGDGGSGDGGSGSGGSGGDAGERRIWQSAVIVGSTRTIDSGRVDLGSGAGRRLVLIADPVLDGVPEAADPFDIRDHVDWLEPTLELDAARLAEEVATRVARGVPALDGWSFVPSGEGAAPPVARFANRWDESDRFVSRFRLVLVVDRDPIVLRRESRAVSGERWVFAALARLPGESSPVDAELVVDGTSVESLDVTEHATDAVPPRALVAMLPRARGTREARAIELRLTSLRGRCEVDVRTLALTSSAPGLLEVFEDDIEVLRARGRIEGSVLLGWQDVHFGVASATVLPGGDVRVEFDGEPIRIRERPRHGDFRFLRFAWRKRGGGRIALGFGHAGRWGPDEGGRRPSFRVDQGRGEPTAGAARRLHHETAQDWTAHTVDLAQTFGDFSLTGIELLCPDGDAALFDHVWLARTPEDWSRIDDRPFLSPQERRRYEERAIEPLRARDANDVTRVTSAIAEGFELRGYGAPFDVDGVELLAEYRGRRGVLRTHPASASTPCVLARHLRLEPGVSSRLLISAAHDLRGGWRLVVAVDGETILAREVGDTTSADGWVDLAVDLADFAGRDVDIEVRNEANGWSFEYAYWSLVRVDDRAR